MIEMEKLDKVKRRFEEVESLMADPEVANDPDRMRELGQEHSRLEEVVEAIDRYERLLGEQEDLKEMIRDESGEMEDLAKDELEQLERTLPVVEEDLKQKLIPKDPEDEKNAIVEIRAGAGGDEASLFAGDLFRLYTQYVKQHGWTYELIDASPGTQGGFREVIFAVKGEDVFGTMKYEAGVHRVQRVPETESGECSERDEHYPNGEGGRCECSDCERPDPPDPSAFLWRNGQAPPHEAGLPTAVPNRHCDHPTKMELVEYPNSSTRLETVSMRRRSGDHSCRRRAIQCWIPVDST